MVSPIARAADAAMEALVVPSFTKLGPAARRRLFDWRDLDGADLTGRVAVVTGATSGLGRATAERLARQGATVVVVGRDEERTRRAADEVASAAGSELVTPVIADTGELDQVRAATDAIRASHERVDVLVHNAGALVHERTTTSAGHEATVASQVVGPFLLTHLLLDALAAADHGRVVTVSSGGMYTAPLTVAGLEMDDASYDGTRQYALAKRAQVTLNEMWAERVDPGRTVFHAMHPGWADTPGVATSLPTFRRVMGPLLRDADDGADTTCWLACDDGEPLASSGGFWLDRRRRPIHRLPSTTRSDTPSRRARLWSWVEERALVDG